MTQGSQKRQSSGGFDRTRLRLTVLGMLVVVAFVALYSRLWFLQVLASDQYRSLAKQNSVRLVYSEPVRGRVVDRHGKVLVDNRISLAVTVDRRTILNRHKSKKVFRRLSKLLHVKKKVLEQRANDNAVSPYKPVAVANDVPKKHILYLREHQDLFPGVSIDKLPVRTYPHNDEAAQVLGYTGEISADQLKEPYFKDALLPYQAGDIVGKSGVELQYDHWLRGRPAVQKVIVNSAGDVISSKLKHGGGRGDDLVLGVDHKLQHLTENALRSGLEAARSSYGAPAGAVVVMDPRNGAIRAMASSPTYNPKILADGFSTKEYKALGQGTPNNPDDDALLNRTTQVAFSPGSTYKPVTAGAALWTGLASYSTYLPCPAQFDFRKTIFHNFEPYDSGSMGFPQSLEVSCDTFYYQLGAKLEEAYGPPESAGGNGTEKFQQYARRAGFGHTTGIDLPGEAGGNVPDKQWCLALAKEIPGFCADGWLPGYTVNMAIGQGDLIATPLQLATTYAAIANGGKVMQPHVAERVVKQRPDGTSKVVHVIKPKVVHNLGLDSLELGVIQQGLGQVISGSTGTAHSAFAGFPLNRFPLAGKTGTAEIGNTGKNNAWFVSYGPTTNPKYVIAVLVQQAGFGGESAAPVARQIWEGIAGVDHTTKNIIAGSDTSR